MDGHQRRSHAFTIVEMLAVIGVIALLLGILVPALSGVIKKGRKQTELNSLRQVGLAWMVYANSSNDYVLPGFLEPDVQERWRVTYEFPNRALIPPAPLFDPADTRDNNVAGPWTWRLMPYMDYSHNIVHGHLQEPEFDAMTIAGDLTVQEYVDEIEEIAYEPAFGYNALYIGGWWEMKGGTGLPRPRYFDAEADVQLFKGGSMTTVRKQVPVVSRSISTIRNSTEVLVFCSSSLLTAGLYRSWPDNQDGYHLVVPPLLGTEPHWSVPGAELGAIVGDAGGSSQLASGSYDPTSLVVQFPATAAPIGRYTGLAVTLAVDCHTAIATPGHLADQRKWIDVADSRLFMHD